MRIAINGFGRIGRIFFRQVFRKEGFEVVAVNDLGDKENLLYLLEHDSVYGKFALEEHRTEIGTIQFFKEKDPVKLPWGKIGVDVVVESTGAFESAEKASVHLKAGAKRVVITAPAKDDTLTFTPNILSEDIAEALISSNASCTTNSVTPVMAIMASTIGVRKALLTTVHGYTATQSLVDSPSSGKGDPRRGRAAAVNIVPASTGAARAAAKVVKSFEGKFDGVALRVPVVCGSVSDFTFLTDRSTSVEEVNEIFRRAASAPEWRGILRLADPGTVSSDIIGDPHGSIIDLEMTRVVDGDLVKVMAWYDNEWGYCAMLIKHIETLKDFL